MTETKIARTDILRIIDSLAAEKNIDREKVFCAVEEAVQRAGRSNFGIDMDIRAHINRRNGTISLARYKKIVEEVENPHTEITLGEAHHFDKTLEIGQELIEDLPAGNFGRIAALSGKQLIAQQVREAEREQQFNYYKDRVGTIVNGIVRREEYGNVTLELDNHQAEAYMKRDQRIPRENMKGGEGFEKSRRVRAFITDVVRENRSPQIFVSRTHPQFLIELFRQEVPEIYEGTVEIKAVARDPGSRAKIAVVSYDPSLDPVGTCVGIRGIRVRPVVEELQGEKIDIILWNENIAELAVQALAPAEISRVIVDEELKRLEMIVEDSHLSVAIGRKGQNVRLASQLTGWHIDILTEEQLHERNQTEHQSLRETFMQALEVDEVIAQFLINEGFSSVEDVAYVDTEELLEIEGFSDFAEDLQLRAQNFVEKQKEQERKELEELGMEDKLKTLDEALSTSLLLKLGKADIKTLEDFAGCARDDLIGSEEAALDNNDINKKTADALILKARKMLGWIDDDDNDNKETSSESPPETPSEEDSSAQNKEGGTHDVVNT
jgi:N utilization substance protein A